MSEDLLRKLLTSSGHAGPNATRMWGMTLEPARTARRRRTAVGLSGQPGLLITDVHPHTPIRQAGIHPGDILAACRSAPVHTPQDPQTVDGPTLLTILRAESGLDLRLDPATADRPA